MYERMRRRYYCDFCKKSGGQRYAMENHERGCTANPNRVCGLHLGKHSVLSDPQRPLPELVAIVAGATHEDIESRMPALREATGLWAEGCPACILATLRQGAPGLYANFDFKKELKAFWDEVNNAAYE